MKRLIALLMAVVLIASLAACGGGTQPAEPPAPEPDVAEPSVEGIFTPGTFSGTGSGGYGGDITVSVTFDETSILAVEIAEHGETEAFANTAFQVLIPAIIESQSVSLDTVSGATMTSTALLEAVRNAIIAAGADPDALESLGVAGPALPDITQADVIVVGGGLGGLSAAISAAQNGASVILIEWMGILGGSSRNSGGGISASETQFQVAEDVIITNEDFINFWLSEQADSAIENENFPQADRIEAMVNNSAARLDWLAELGHEYAPPSLLEPFGQGRIHFPAGGISGGILLDFMEDTARALGIEIHTETRGLELVMTDGVVSGVIAEGPAGEITYLANNAVILATGGFAQNNEMIERFIPGIAPLIGHSTAAPGNMGDGILMAEAVGAVPYEQPWIMGSGLLSPVIGGTIMLPGNYVLVNQDGMRYVAETGHYAAHTTDTLVFASGGAFLLIDSSETFANIIPPAEAIDGMLAFTADTIEELSVLIGVDTENLLEALAHVAAVSAGEVDDEFGRPAEFSVPLTVGPFYAVRVLPMIMGTFGGVVTNEYAQVLDADGNVIPGLFAVGEMANRPYYNQIYVGGTGLLIPLSHGIIAGELAARG